MNFANIQAIVLLTFVVCASTTEDQILPANTSCSLECDDICQSADSCFCPNGKKLTPDNRTCTDIDECMERGSCDQICTNTDTGCQHLCLLTNTDGHLDYRCVCNIGYQTDGKNCRPINEFLLYALKRSVNGKVLSPDLTEAVVPITRKKNGFVSVDFDARDQQIYYSTVIINGIYRSDRKGISREVVLELGNNSDIEGIAVDWVSKNLYFVDGRRKTLNVMSTRNLTYQRTLLGNLRKPRGIAVHPNKGYVFFSQWATPANISRVFSDGTNLIVFKNLKLGWINGLAIDFERDRLYWCDAKPGEYTRIQHSNLDGEDVQDVKSQLIRHPFSIAVYKDFLYVSDWKVNAIIKLHKLSGESEEAFIKEEKNRFFGVKIYSESVQQVDLAHPCWNSNGQCEKLCFAVPRGDGGGLSVRCGCPEGEILMQDQKTCQ